MAYTTLKELRIGRKWSRERLAVELGVSLTTVGNLERGRFEPRLGLARRIAEVFGVPLDSIQWGGRAGPKSQAA